MLAVDDAWLNFINDSGETVIGDSEISFDYDEIKDSENDFPKCSEIYISTQTKIAHLNQSVDLNMVFWNVPVINYQQQTEGVIKKQMKINCLTKDETIELDKKIKSVDGVIIADVIQKIDNPNARKLKYKDVRKINVGLCKKDLISYRTKRKGAFYNCFVLIVRLKNGDVFKESHVKIFNTGKLEIPGIQKSYYLNKILDALVIYLQPYFSKVLTWNKNDVETVLINSNFTCNYYIDRDILSHILKYDYNLHVVYDPCSYPGIQCKYYYNKDNHLKNGICNCEKKCTKKGSGKGKNQCLEISFMIFRTGSVLIVGHCDESILNKIYVFLKNILINEYNKIKINSSEKKSKPKAKKVWKKTIIIDI